MYCIVVAGAAVPEMPEAPVFSVGMVGFNGNWDADVDMTLEGDYYVIKGQVVAANDQFKIRISHSWDESYGMPGDVEPQTVNADAMYSLVQGGKNMSATAGTYDIYFNYVAKEFYLLTPGTTPQDLAIPQYKIYVYNHETNWANVYLYTWDSNDTNPMGAWPGSLSHSTEIINGYEYLVWTMPRTATGMSLNAILNNNGGSQTADYAIGTLSADVYLRLNNGVLESIDDKNNPEPVIPIETYKVYVYKFNNTWTTLNLYSWDAQSQATYTGGWPGTKNALTEDINGYTYYVWDATAITYATEEVEKAPLVVLEEGNGAYMIEYDAGDKTIIEAGIVFGENATVDSCAGKATSQKNASHGQFTAESNGVKAARGYIIYRDGTDYKVKYSD
jgi:hypothetical protein